MLMRKRSYVWKISLPYLILILVSLLGISLYLSSYFQNFIEENWKNNLTDQAHLYAELTAPIVDQGDPYVGLTDLITSSSAGTLDRVTIILPDGLVIADNEADPAAMENHANRPEVKSALSGQFGTDIRTSTTLGTRFLYVAVPVEENGKIIAIARLSISLASLDNSVNKIHLFLLIFSSVIILITLLYSLFYAFRKNNPLTQLTDTVEGVRKGQTWNIELNQRNDEIGTLASSFFDLTNQLNHQIVDLKNERMKLAAILTNMTDGAILVNLEGIVTLINPAARHLFGFYEDIASSPRTLIEIVRAHEIVNVWNQCQQSNQQQTVAFETPINRDYLQVIGTRLKPALPEFTLLLFQNLTTQRKLETVRRDFVSNVSHELRTPLASLKALTETLQQGALTDPPAAQRFLSQMDDEIDNLTQMVQELLELSRIESGKVPLQKKLITPLEVIEPAVKRMILQAQRSSLELVNTCPEFLPEINVDSSRLQQVLVNLIHNAIKFTPPTGRIEVSARAEEKFVIFSVQDSGIGIPPDDLARIFERFYKADRARTSGGTGLGLSICRHLVEAHGGTIWADSRPGEGSTFFFSIPIAKFESN
jgi:two-component system phosphate regulon sensor histidine kinase PhoR